MREQCRRTPLMNRSQLLPKAFIFDLLLVQGSLTLSLTAGRRPHFFEKLALIHMERIGRGRRQIIRAVLRRICVSRCNHVDTSTIEISRVQEGSAIS